MLGCVYREEEASGDEGTARVEGSSATHIQVGLVVELQHSQEVRTLQLWKTLGVRTLQLWMLDLHHCE